MGISDSGDDDAAEPNDSTVVRPLSPTESASGLFDDGDDDEASGSSSAKRRRLRRGGTVPLKHPALPAAPMVHLYTKQRNHDDLKAPWDYDKKVIIKRLLDCHGNPPHRCYLVQWQGRPLQLSWLWREELVDVVPDSVNRIDAWKASGSKEPIMSYFDNRDTASDDDCCFIDAIRAALYHLGCPDLVTVEMWEAFEKTRPPDIQYGVTREDVTEFFKYLQRKSVPLDCDELQRNLLDGSYTNAAQLNKFIRGLGSGTYLASVGEDDLGYCFVVIVEGPNDDIKVLGWYDEKRNPPVDAGLLRNYLWVNRARWLCRIILKAGYVCRGKRKSRSQKKREKRERLHLQSS